MSWVIKIESYGPVLKMLGERETADNDAIFALLIAVASVPLLLFIAYSVRKWLQRRNNIARGHAALEKLVDQKNLNYLEQVTVEHLAQAANLQNAAQILTSIHVFDQAVAAWMQQVQQMPWLEMEEQVERLSFLRKTLGFRYLAADRLPTTTRELMLGQNLYMLAGGAKGPRLLSTTILDLNDLAIHTGPFEVNKRPVNVKKNQDGWVFFWTETGKEYRFKTRILKSAQNPTPSLVLQHGDTLVSDDGRKTFSCDMEQELVADLLPVTKYGRATPSPALFERLEEQTKTISLKLLELSGSGFVISGSENIEPNDLLRIKSGGFLGVLEKKVARAVRIHAHYANFKFIKLPPGDLDILLQYITTRISTANFLKKTGESTLTND